MISAQSYPGQWPCWEKKSIINIEVVASSDSESLGNKSSGQILTSSAVSSN